MVDVRRSRGRYPGAGGLCNPSTLFWPPVPRQSPETELKPEREICEMIPTKLLLVDDEEPFVNAMEKRLSHRNIEVFTAYSGKEALERLDQIPEIDVVILDSKMPGMDGIATLREIKNAHPTVEVIMLTGHATFDSAIEGMKLGALDYLMKPVDMDQLLAKVDEARTKKEQHQQKILEATGRELRGRRGR
jgi:DNA-binding NtrC family response regulator